MFDLIKEMYGFLLESFQTYSGLNLIWMLYPLALLLILIFGKRTDRRLFLGSLAVEILTIFNPFFINAFLKIFSFENRYLRFFWMNLYFIAIAYSMVLVISRFRHFLVRALLFVLCALSMVSLGIPVYYGKDVPEYRMATNAYFVGDEILQLSEIFHSEGLETPRVLYGGMMLVYPQYDHSVISILTRPGYQKMQNTSLEDYMASDRYSDSSKLLCRVYYYGDFTVPAQDFYSVLTKRKVNYVLSATEGLDQYLSTTPATVLGQTENYRVWKVN